MADAPAIKVDGLGKRYFLGATISHNMLREQIMHGVRSLVSLGRGRRPSAEEFWALKDVSFEVAHGEVVGIIGRNGAGKSTLLKILSQITEPTEGEIRLRGRVASLLEVGTGFHPELSGRENIFLNGAILGMTRAEIKSKFDEIVDFSGIEKFLDTPVKRYSSGMYVRLAFAVAAHLQPEILLVDEVLAVGDIEFQKKCLGKMSAVARSGRTVLFVSHNMAAIEALCSRAILLDHGLEAAEGVPTEVVRTYCERNSTEGFGAYNRSKDPADTCIHSARIWAETESAPGTFPIGADLQLEVAIKAQAGQELGLGVGIDNQNGIRVTTLHTKCSSLVARIEADGQYVFKCQVSQLALAPGEYTVKLSLDEQVSGVSLEALETAFDFRVVMSDYFSNGGKIQQRGVVLCMQKWRCESEMDLNDDT